jgi:nicotinate phosphoribosyltransferase
MIKRLHIADTEQVKSGRVTDVYFIRTEQVLSARGINQPVCMEIFLKSFPHKEYSWGVFAGLEDVCTLLEGRPVNVRAMPEGSIFFTGEPVMAIEGKYLDFGELETAILGCICQASGIATKASRLRIACGDKKLISFGARRMHPSIAPMVERAAYIGGCDGVATIAAAELIDEKPVGTMPHALILQLGDTVTAALAFDEVIEADVPRVVLIDTFQDEKFEALRVAEALGQKLAGIRFDTPSSRRGNFRRILEEVRWELDLRGYKHVKLFVSGGLDVSSVIGLHGIADAFGIGTSISSAATLDFSMDIVEIQGKPFSKRGKESGRKSVFRCRDCMKGYVLPFSDDAPDCTCGNKTMSLLKDIISEGIILSALPSAGEIRKQMLKGLASFARGRDVKEVLGI